jgi:hypothetical protein
MYGEMVAFFLLFYVLVSHQAIPSNHLGKAKYSFFDFS